MRIVILLTLATVAAAYDFVEGEVTWNLDRIDQAKAAWPNWDEAQAEYDPIATGGGSVVYVVGSGLQATHNNFGPGMLRQSVTYDFDPNNQPQGSDTHGRSTAVSGVVGGVYTGVAKTIEISTVRVAAEPNRATIDMTNVFEGMQAIIDDYKVRKAANPTNYLRGVAFGGVYFDVATTDPTILNTLEGLLGEMVANDLVVIGGIGEGDRSDCMNFSPARLYADESIIIVGGTNMLDFKDSSSNYGECAEVWAPMDGIWSSAIDHNDTTRTDYYAEAEHVLELASAHVAGVAAIVRGYCPDASSSDAAGMTVAFSASNGGRAYMPATQEDLGPIIRVATTKEEADVPPCP